MNKPIVTLWLTAAALIAGAAPALGASDYQARHGDLVTLAGIFGELHHIRRNCEPRREADIWRDRMRRLVDLEEPRDLARNEMVASFNKSYRNAQGRYAYCDRDARAHAARRAAEGDAVIVRLMAPLYEAVAEDGELPTVWRGADSDNRGERQ